MKIFIYNGMNITNGKETGVKMERAKKVEIYYLLYRTNKHHRQTKILILENRKRIFVASMRVI